MAVSLRLVQVRSVVSGSTPYRVANTVDQNVNIPAQVFVFATETGLYDRVASVSDLETLPYTTQADALANGAAYYRMAAVTKDWAILNTAEEFATMVRGRLKALVVEYNAAQAAFIGTTTETYSS